MACRVCNGELMEVENVEGCWAERIEHQEKSFQMNVKDLMLYKCTKCTHLQIDNILPEDYYESYVANGDGYLQYQGDLNLTAKKINKLSKYALSHERMVEIGSGGGGSLTRSETSFFQVLWRGTFDT